MPASVSTATGRPFVGGALSLRELYAGAERRDLEQGPVPSHLLPGGQFREVYVRPGRRPAPRVAGGAQAAPEAPQIAEPVASHGGAELAPEAPQTAEDIEPLGGIPAPEPSTPAPAPARRAPHEKRQPRAPRPKPHGPAQPRGGSRPGTLTEDGKKKIGSAAAAAWANLAPEERAERLARLREARWRGYVKRQRGEPPRQPPPAGACSPDAEARRVANLKAYFASLSPERRRELTAKAREANSRKKAG